MHLNLLATLKNVGTTFKQNCSIKQMLLYHCYGDKIPGIQSVVCLMCGEYRVC